MAASSVSNVTDERPSVSIAEQDSHGFPEPSEDFALPADGWGDGPMPFAPGEAPRGGPGDRTPPQDMAAEQSVLGAMLLSKDSIADVSEVLEGVDF